MDNIEYEVALAIHFNDFYKLKSEPESIYWAGFCSAPDYEQFQTYYMQELERKDRTFIFQQVNDVVSGYIALDLCAEKNVVEISYGIVKAFSGKGLGKLIVKYATELSAIQLSADAIVAWIAETNIASQKVVCANGYLLSVN